MPDWAPEATLRPLNFTITIVPGSSAIQNANAYYEIVLPSGRAVPLSRPLDLAEIQAVIDAAAGTIVQQLLVAEGLTQITPPPPGEGV